MTFPSGLRLFTIADIFGEILMTGKKLCGRDMFREFSHENVPLIDGFIESYFSRKAADAELPFMKELYSDIKEYCLRDGKRIRPILLINSYNGYCRGFRKTGEIIKLGAAVEIMHSFLLVQDDIIDRAEMRRGGEALHILLGKRYSSLTTNPLIGTDIASVLADVMFSSAIDIICSAGLRDGIKTAFMKVFARTYEKTAWGQILDSLNTMPVSIDCGSDAPMMISLMKTAWYTMVYPVMMGYVLSSGSGRKELETIEEFGIPLGIAFQIRDDILGVFGVESDTGKPNDSDILEGKFTLLVHNTMQKLDEAELENFKSVLLSRSKSPDEVRFIRETIKSSGALDETIGRHEKLLLEAEDKLDQLRIKKYSREVLRGVIEAVGDIPV